MNRDDLPIGWQWKTIGDVCRVVPGFAFKSKYWTTTGIPVVKIKNIKSDCTVDVSEADCVPAEIITEKLNKFRLGKGDILIAMTGATAGKVGWLSAAGEFLLNQRVAKLEPTAINKLFFWGVVSGRRYQDLFFHLADGAAQPNMSGSQIEGIEIPVPPVSVQEKIAGIVAAYDDLIENNTRRIAILEEMARRLYEEWFIHFRFPGHEELEFDGEPPRGWSEAMVEDFGEVVTGKTPTKKRADFFNGDVPFLRLPDMHGNVFVTSTSDTLTAAGANTQRNKFIPAGSLCVSCIGTVGIVVITSEPCQTNQQINSLVLRDSSTKEFMFFALKFLKGTIERYAATGATMANLSRGKFSALKMLRPADELISQFHDTTSPMMGMILSLQRKNANLRAQRDMLLPKLVTGEIDVSEAEGALEAAE